MKLPGSESATGINEHHTLQLKNVDENASVVQAIEILLPAWCVGF